MTKRLLDIILASIGLVVLSPVLLAVSLAVLASMGRPVLFSQVRVGRGGRQFRILKFRSMSAVTGQAAPQVTGSKDPRITRVGRVLRRTKLDELPQLWNVVVGQMSMVGPRPEVPKFVAFYTEEQRAKVLSVRPGITDPAALAYIDEESMLASAEDPERVYVEQILPAKIRAYIDYVEQRSLMGDFGVIVATVTNLIRRA